MLHSLDQKVERFEYLDWGGIQAVGLEGGESGGMLRRGGSQAVCHEGEGSQDPVLRESSRPEGQNFYLNIRRPIIRLTAAT